MNSIKVKDYNFVTVIEKLLRKKGKGAIVEATTVQDKGAKDTLAIYQS